MAIKHDLPRVCTNELIFSLNFKQYSIQALK